jgi:hypothetical protein
MTFVTGNPQVFAAGIQISLNSQFGKVRKPRGACISRENFLFCHQANPGSLFYRQSVLSDRNFICHYIHTYRFSIPLFLKNQAYLPVPDYLMLQPPFNPAPWAKPDRHEKILPPNFVQHIAAFISYRLCAECLDPAQRSGSYGLVSIRKLVEYEQCQYKHIWPFVQPHHR